MARIKKFKRMLMGGNNILDLPLETIRPRQVKKLAKIADRLKMLDLRSK